MRGGACGGMGGGIWGAVWGAGGGRDGGGAYHAGRCERCEQRHRERKSKRRERREKARMPPTRNQRRGHLESEMLRGFYEPRQFVLGARAHLMRDAIRRNQTQSDAIRRHQRAHGRT